MSESLYLGDSVFLFRKKSKVYPDRKIIHTRGILTRVEGSRAKGYEIELLLGRSKEQERVIVLDVPDNRTHHFPHDMTVYKTYTIDGVRRLIDPRDGMTTYKVVPHADRDRTDDE